MNCKYRCLIIFILMNIFFGICCIFLWGKIGLINFESGFLSFLAVIYSTYFSLKRKIKKELSNIQPIDEEDTNKPKSKFSFSNVILGLQVSMGIFRLCSYLILLLLLLFLMSKKIFLAIPYIIGVIICLNVVVVLKYLSQKYHDKKSNHK
ncbi:hypothetical protein [Helicobacter sp. 13S00477-4]|uniref:hypothetical protein n=1 Tax=Helicobacter sp. 13S00477-4 TaxID=1905759 RepID=UPI000BA64FD0|nr:hypothetical protein [Helicobacter sp. 13S00477-4]PAF52477.1 hypothetical protein BKH44_01465 [Helicobacter sp. 13S00477-4]